MGNAAGELMAMQVRLSQAGMPCSVSARNDKYFPTSGRSAMQELTTVLTAGMTPVVSFWSSRTMGWMDGPGRDGQGPCLMGADDPERCPEFVKFYNYQIVDIG